MSEPRYTHHRIEDEPDDEIRGFPHLFESAMTATYDGVEEVLAWCTAQFGPTTWRDPDRWMESSHGSAIWFRRDQDAFEFRIRWC